MTASSKPQNSVPVEVRLEPAKTLNVEFYKSSRADVVLSCTYIKSGQQEIRNYTEDVCKPEMDKYISEQAQSVFTPLIGEAQSAADSAKASARECAGIVAGLNMESILETERYERSEADAALQRSLDAAREELTAELALKAASADVYTKSETAAFLAEKAPLNSPALSGTPTTPTAAGGNDLQIANMAAVKNKIAAGLSQNGLYVRMTVQENMWCREWFSDEAMTQRVWLEQGGYATVSKTGVTETTLTFLQPFSGKNYFFTRSLEHYFSGSVSNCQAWGGYHGKRTTGVGFFADHNYITSYSWYACGN